MVLEECEVPNRWMQPRQGSKGILLWWSDIQSEIWGEQKLAHWRVVSKTYEKKMRLEIPLFSSCMEFIRYGVSWMEKKKEGAGVFEFGNSRRA